jgi:predicted permease
VGRLSFSAWLRRRRLDLDEEDFTDEIRAHLAIAEAERIADGSDRDAARYAARREFGNVTLTTEAARRVWTPPWLETLRDLLNDGRYAVRSLAKSPVFSITVIAVLTLGIGLNSAVFTMLKGMALAPIAGVDGSAGLGVIYGETDAGRELRVSYPDYRYLRDHNRSFTELFGTSLATVNLGKGRSARQVWGELVTGNYFQALGVRAAIGRTLLPSDEVAPGGHPVVVLGHVTWLRDFNADPDIVGKTVFINNRPLTVVGVAESSFHGATVSSEIEVFIPVMMMAELGFTGGLPREAAATLFSDPRAAIVFPHGFLRPGVTAAAATVDAGSIWSQLSNDRPIADAAMKLEVTPFWLSPTGGQTFLLPTLSVLTAMGLLVLLIACANIAGLVLVRGVSRRGEIAVRLALGAARRRIVRLLVIESVVLALPGAIFGVALARYGIPVLVGYAEWLAAPQRIFLNVGVDGLVITFAVLVACASALACGFVPALQSSRVDLVSVINADASPRGASRARVRAGLVVAQVAVSLLLLVGAGLAARTVDAARRADPGFDVRGVASIALDVRQNGYDEARGRAFYRQLLDSVRAVGGVDAATLAVYQPMSMVETRALPVTIEGYEPRRGEDPAMLSNTVASDYFRTLAVPLLSGRAFMDSDDDGSAAVAIVNRTLAERFWGGAPAAIGRRLRVADGGWRTVIGVVADLKYARIDEAPRPYVYLPFAQAYRSNMILYARAASGSNLAVERLVELGRARIEALDADLPVLYARPMGEATRGALIFFDLTATMLLIFGAAGMVLAVMGTYGLVSYVVRQSTREIGIRLALGATGASVVRGFVARGIRLGVIGAGLGVLAALGVTRLLASVLFGVSPTDLPSFAVALTVVLGGVVLATLVPAWRAARTSAIRALRHQ